MATPVYKMYHAGAWNGAFGGFSPGSRLGANNICTGASGAITTYPPYSSLLCADGVAFVTFGNEDLSTLSFYPTVLPTSLRVDYYQYNGVSGTLQPTYAGMFTPAPPTPSFTPTPSPTLARNMMWLQFPSPSPSPRATPTSYWTGFGPTGQYWGPSPAPLPGDYNCFDWLDSSSFGVYGTVGLRSNNYLVDGIPASSSCDGSSDPNVGPLLVCLCIPTIPTPSPTKQPTNQPTSSSPTTSSPSRSPTTQHPSTSPTTSVPTKSPSRSPSESPSLAPTTSAPSQSPTTSQPTAAPTLPNDCLEPLGPRPNNSLPGPQAP